MNFANACEYNDDICVEGSFKLTHTPSSVLQTPRRSFQVVDDVMLSGLLRRKIDLLVGPRSVHQKSGVVRQRKRRVDIDKISFCEIKVSDEADVGKKDFRLQSTMSTIVNNKMYTTVASEIPVSCTRDDSILYIKKPTLDDENAAEFLFRTIALNTIEEGNGAFLTKQHKKHLEEGFRGVVLVGYNCFSIETNKEEVSVGVKSSDMEIIGDGIQGVFSINLRGLVGCGTRVQKVGLPSEHADNAVIEFEYYRSCNVMNEEDIMNYYLDHKHVVFEDFFHNIVCISQPGSLVENCLRFVELKVSLFLGGSSVLPHEIGRSLLVFSRMFGGHKLIFVVNKLIEYIECIICEIPTCEKANEMLFLHETCIFLNKIVYIGSELSQEVGSNSSGFSCSNGVKPLHTLTYHLIEEEGAASKSSIHHLWIDCKSAVSKTSSVSKHHYSLRGSKRDVKKCLSERMGCFEIIVKSSVSDRLAETLFNFRVKGALNRSFGFCRMLCLQERIMKIWKVGLTKYIPQNKLNDCIHSIFEKDPFTDSEIFAGCMIIRNISSMVPINTSILDKPLARHVNKTMFEFSKALRRFLKAGTGDIKDIFRVLHKLYFDLRKLGSKIHEDMFKNNVHYIIEDENVNALRKISTDNKAGLKRLWSCRQSYEEHRKTLEIISHDTDSRYLFEERRVFMQFYDVKKIEVVLKSPHMLEAEILKMIKRGVTADDGGCSDLYKSYLYERIKEVAELCLGEEYDRVMLSVGMCFSK